MGAYASSLPSITDPFMVEANAVVRVLEFAQNMGFKKIGLEGDALSIVKKLQSVEVDLSPR
ncbi:hypothetical protein CRYUN_Cryun06bG0118500 [Craigia yunnanensis]